MFTVALVTADEANVPAWVRQDFDEAAIALVSQRCRDAEAFTRVAAEADVVWTFGTNTVITAASLHRLRRCSAIVRGGSGTDGLPVDQATALGILVVNTPAALAEEVAEHALALLLAVIRKIAVHDRQVRHGQWNETPRPRGLLRGRTLGLIGFGHVARALLAGLEGFRMTTLVHDPWVDDREIARHGCRAVPLPVLLAESDYISVHCPLTEATRHLLSAREFGLMKPTAVLVNTARGAVLDEQALVAALAGHTIAGAGLDVLAAEPPDPCHPLFALDTVIVTPHIAAYSDDFSENIWRHAVDSIIALSQSRRPASCVNPGVTSRRPLIGDRA